MYVHSRRVPTIMTSSIMTACSGMCGKSIGNGVNIFVHFSSTPISILNLTMSSESQESDVSNDILSERKYSQLFMHESNISLLKQLYQANRFTYTTQRWHRSLFIDCTDRRTEKQVKHDLRQFHSVHHLADIKKQLHCTSVIMHLYKSYM